ncbi:MAG: methionyl-tRNA formyltransferase [Leptospiraceae bacterium]|nr:methionyl-tRNA formyltransferase [Leptospiraceae bacterium]MDW8306255.1 methionyl-tRNA formyltransferase [Leptospiraceae bacterium]
MLRFAIAYWGTPSLSAKFLERLCQDDRFDVKFVVTQKDKPRSKRSRQILPSPVKLVAQNYGIRIFEPVKLALESEIINEEAIRQKVVAHVVLAYGKIIPRLIFDLPPLKTVNFHASLLPKLRGASPIETALLHDFRETGWTLQLITEALDAGDILGQLVEPIYPEDDARSLTMRLEKRLLEGGAELLLRYLKGEALRQRQDEKEVSFCNKINPEDLRLNFSESLAVVRNKARAYSLRGGLYVFLKQKRVRIEADFEALAHQKPEPQPEAGVFVLKPRPGICLKDGIFFIKRLQVEGGRWLTPQEFHNGYARGAIVRFK